MAKYEIIGDMKSKINLRCINVVPKTSETMFLDRKNLDFFMVIGSMMTCHTYHESVIVNKTINEMWFSVNTFIMTNHQSRDLAFSFIEIDDMVKAEKAKWDENGLTFDMDFVYYEGSTEPHFIRLIGCKPIPNYKPRKTNLGVRIKFTYDAFIDELSPEDIAKNNDRIRFMYNCNYIPMLAETDYNKIINVVSRDYGKRPIRVFIAQLSGGDPLKLKNIPEQYKLDISLIIRYYFNISNMVFDQLEFNPYTIEILDPRDIELRGDHLFQKEVEMQRLSSFIGDMAQADLVIFPNEIAGAPNQRIACEINLQKEICDLYGKMYLSFNDILYTRGISKDVDDAIDRVFGTKLHDIMLSENYNE